MPKLTTLLIKVPRDLDVTPEATQTFLSTLTQINSVGKWKRFTGTKPLAVALEIAVVNQQIMFMVTADTQIIPFVESQIQSNYPLALIEKHADPLAEVIDDLSIYFFRLKKGTNYPIATFTHFTDIDPLSSVLTVMGKAPPDKIGIVQIAIESTSGEWQQLGAKFADQGARKEDGSYSPRSDASIIKEKILFPGFKTSIRVASNDPILISSITSAFNVYTRPDGNSLYASSPSTLKKKRELADLLERQVADKQVLNIQEIATLWHLPGEKIKAPSILWGNSILTEAPTNLPIAIGLTEEEKRGMNFFARTSFKNKETVFGIKDKDRLRHIWAVGKTGSGKSTLIANMAIDDIKKGRGLAIIDPHGDLCEDVLDFIPSNRINDVIYFNPADKEYPITINPLEVTNREDAELIVAGLMSIFTKVWANVWSARMEYILRNSFFTLAEVENATLSDVLRLLSNQSYRNKVISKTTDDALIHFWKDEFDQMPEKLQKEAISPIQNKVGQFVTSPMIRRIIGSPKSSIKIDDIMNQKKIFLINLSQGRLGEDNAALLGAMMITKFQLAAMHRVSIPKEERVPFYLYVDEFQNFATESFIKILSEARKYGLALLLANQYMAQIPDPIQKAILGNAGSLVTFSCGADDAGILHKEFAEVFSDNDLVNLARFQIAIKLMIDSHSSRPFLATTLPMPIESNSNREKVIRNSRERYAKKVSESKPESGVHSTHGKEENKNETKPAGPPPDSPLWNETPIMQQNETPLALRGFVIPEPGITMPESSPARSSIEIEPPFLDKKSSEIPIKHKESSGTTESEVRDLEAKRLEMLKHELTKIKR